MNGPRFSWVNPGPTHVMQRDLTFPAVIVPQDL